MKRDNGLGDSTAMFIEPAAGPIGSVLVDYHNGNEVNQQAETDKRDNKYLRVTDTLSSGHEVSGRKLAKNNTTPTAKARSAKNPSTDTHTQDNLTCSYIASNVSTRFTFHPADKQKT